MISIVVAYSSNRVIGRKGGIPWRLPTDLRRFRELTSGGVVVMGRKTFESLPAAYRPLPDRRNIVLSSDPRCEARGAEVLASLPVALEAAGPDCFVIGGGATYAQALRHCERVYATEIAELLEGDTSFPVLPEHEWCCAESSEAIVENGYEFSFKVYERRND